MPRTNPTAIDYHTRMLHQRRAVEKRAKTRTVTGKSRRNLFSAFIDKDDQDSAVVSISE